MTDTALIRGLPEGHRAFVAALASGASTEEAESLAGYAEGTGRGLLRRSDIRMALDLAIRIELQNAAPLALKALLNLVKSGSERVRADAAKLVLDRAGFTPPAKQSDMAGAEKQLAEMSQDELHAAMAQNSAKVDQLERELAARATQINAPIPVDPGQKGRSFLD